MFTSPPPITDIGIPTRNRAESLKRCILSFHEHAIKSGRHVDFTTIDRSDTQEKIKENISIVHLLSSEFDISIRHLNYSDCNHLALVIANTLGIDDSITRFALIGDTRCQYSYGANRNALLLLSAGKRTIQTDDDTLCHIAQPPDHQKGVSISTQRTPYSYRYFATAESALSSVQPVAVNLLSEHDALLGQNTMEVIGRCLLSGKEPTVSLYDATTLDALSHPESSISTTLTGAVGDSGNQNYAFRLLENSYLLQRSRESRKVFRDLITTRWTVRTVPQTTLSLSTHCMTTHIGINGCHVQPPFMPVMRNEDGVFGSVQHICFPFRISGIIPYTIQHLPLEIRNTPLFSKALQTPGMRTNDLIRQLILYARPDTGEAIELSDLGDYLKEISSLRFKSFKKKVQKSADKTLGNIISYAEEKLESQPDAPAYWKDGIYEYINSLKSKQETIIPLDLPGSTHSRWILFQDLVNQYGLLLIHWKSIYNAAKTLSAINKLNIAKKI